MELFDVIKLMRQMADRRENEKVEQGAELGRSMNNILEQLDS